MKLLMEALIKFGCGLLLVGLLIFLPAGTLAYTGGWPLTRELPGYAEYKQKVQYRLILFVW